MSFFYNRNFLLSAAEKLTSGLASENERWARDLQDLHEKQRNLIGDCLLGAGFLAYLGPFTWEYRQELMYVSWTEQLNSQKIPLSSPFKVEQLLSSEVEIARWNSQGLPPDELSTQNGILSLQGSRVPVCIDPQMQAAVWFKMLENSEKHPCRVSRRWKWKIGMGWDSVEYSEYSFALNLESFILKKEFLSPRKTCFMGIDR